MSKTDRNTYDYSDYYSGYYKEISEDIDLKLINGKIKNIDKIVIEKASIVSTNFDSIIKLIEEKKQILKRVFIARNNLNKLKQKHKQLLLECFYYKKSAEDLASKYQITLNALHRKVKRAVGYYYKIKEEQRNENGRTNNIRHKDKDNDGVAIK